MDLPRYRRVTAAAAVLLGAIIVSGAAVRLTGSGLGCTDWPTCEDTKVVGDFGYHGWIEYGNRLVTGLVSLVVALAVLGSLRLTPRRPDLTRWSLGLVAGVIGQIVLGALVVYLELDPRLVIGHFLLSMVLLWNAVVLHHKAGREPVAEAARVEPPPIPVGPTWTGHVRVLSGLATAVLVTGTIVTGSGPHTGSLDEPIERLPYAIPEVARIHSTVVWCLVIGTAVLAWRLHRTAAAPPARRHVHLALGIMAAQGAVGYTQYALDVPVGLVALHIVGAVVLWATMVGLHLRMVPPAVPAQVGRPSPSARPETARI